jgi:pimeloyl-ACP methyl ester carboxylesterase
VKTDLGNLSSTGASPAPQGTRATHRQPGEITQSHENKNHPQATSALTPWHWPAASPRRLGRGMELATKIAAQGKTVPPAINDAPFRASDLTPPKDERLAALKLAFFAPGHDPSIWLDGWYPQTLAMQHAAVTAVGSQLDRYWAAGTAPVFEIIAEYDPFHQETQWGDLRAQFGPRVTTTVIADASHALFPEQPATVASAVLDYLRTLDVPVSAARINP